jgi:hypothetical protein
VEFLGDIVKGDVIGEIRPCETITKFLTEMGGKHTIKELKDQDGGKRVEITFEKFPFPTERVMWNETEFKSSSKYSEFKASLEDNITKLKEHLASLEKVRGCL